jgi:integrase
MARPLNATIVENSKPDRTKRIEIPDGALVGLYLVVQPSGAKSFAVRYRAAGRPRKLTLGPYPRLKLADAREAAREALRFVSEGGDPADDRTTLQKLKRVPALPPRNTFETVLERFIASQRRKGRRSADEIRRVLEKDALPHWRDKPIEAINAADVIEAIEAIVERGAPVAASRFRAWCSKFFSYAVQSQLRSDNPAKTVENPIDPKSIQRNRKLNDHELALVWQCATELGYPFGPAIKLLLLTGQRLREVFEARWSEFDLAGAVWSLPASRTKGRAEHIVPLSNAAVEILGSIPRIQGSPFVFTTTGNSPVSGFSKAKSRLEVLLGAKNHGGAIPTWRFHDLRRTFVSGCARLRISSEVVERAINHRSESFGGVRGVYNVHAYEDERRAAMTTWANHVMQLVSSERV